MPRKPASSVRIFHANLSEQSGGDWMSEQLHLLDQASLRRADEISHQQRREQFLLGRMLLWKALQEGYAIDRQAGWRFESGPGGKPLLLGPQGPAGLSVSISHSHDQVVCVLSDGCSVGIDVERYKPRDVAGLGQAVMTQTERSHLSGLESAAQELFFYRCWTSKEACAKAIGAEQAPAFNLLEVLIGEMSTNIEGAAYEGITWGNREYVTSLVCEGGADLVEMFKLEASGNFQADLMTNAMPLRIRLQD